MTDHDDEDEPDYDPTNVTPIARKLMPAKVLDNKNPTTGEPYTELHEQMETPMIDTHAGTSYVLTRHGAGLSYAISAVMPDGSVVHEILDINNLVFDWVTQVLHGVPVGMTTKAFGIDDHH